MPVLVVGAGLIGLSVAEALARRGAPVTLVSEPRPGESSVAAAGMLAPTLEPLTGPALNFALQARERYPGFLADLEERTSVRVPLDREGILELAHDAARAERLQGTATAGVHWLDASDTARLEPALAPVIGALFHPLDGSVDNVALFQALERLVASRSGITRVHAAAVRIRRRGDEGAAVHTASGDVLEARTIVIAAGAWSGRLNGLPRSLPVEPARGQMIALRAPVLGHVVYSEDAYLVPRRDGRTLVGATMERVGFDTSTTADALDGLHARGGRVAPVLRSAPVASAWAGLRPMTPDGLPVIGRDPDWPAILYATGHSRNGILMAPLTGDCIAALALDEEPPADLSAFSIRRFDGRRAQPTG